MSTRVRKLGTGACFSVSARQILHFTSNVAPVDVAIRPASGTKAALTDGGGLTLRSGQAMTFDAASA